MVTANPKETYDLNLIYFSIWSFFEGPEFQKLVRLHPLQWIGFEGSCLEVGPFFVAEDESAGRENGRKSILKLQPPSTIVSKIYRRFKFLWYFENGTTFVHPRNSKRSMDLIFQSPADNFSVQPDIFKSSKQSLKPNLASFATWKEMYDLALRFAL